MSKAIFPLGSLPNQCPRLKSNSEEAYKKLAEQLADIDRMPKNLCMYDADTVLFTPNFIPGEKHDVRIIDGDLVNFDGNLPFTNIIYSTQAGMYCYDYAYIYKGKLVAIGEERGRCGGLTHILTKEENPKEIIERLSKSNNDDSKLLYEKIKDIKIAISEELPKCPKLVYRVSDNNGNTYYLNDNTDKTYTLWRVRGEEYNGVELITSPYIEAIKQSLFTSMIMDIDKVISETNGDK